MKVEARFIIINIDTGIIMAEPTLEDFSDDQLRIMIQACESILNRRAKAKTWMNRPDRFQIFCSLSRPMLELEIPIFYTAHPTFREALDRLETPFKQFNHVPKDMTKEIYVVDQAFDEYLSLASSHGGCVTFDLAFLNCPQSVPFLNQYGHNDSNNGDDEGESPIPALLPSPQANPNLKIPIPNSPNSPIKTPSPIKVNQSHSLLPPPSPNVKPLSRSQTPQPLTITFGPHPTS